ncbi:hypothetical protein [Coleofasciculus sp. E2-BRE-01]|uniref:hypothetical protein n=1 Tax=Coleofasciculus sp. E2-BRE-01 TaxID=3069524 RepID=UPI0033050BBA
MTLVIGHLSFVFLCLWLFHCDRVRSRLIQCLKDLSSVDIRPITLNPDDTALYQAFIKDKADTIFTGV